MRPEKRDIKGNRMKTQNLSYQSRPLIWGGLCSTSSCGQYPVM